MIGIGGGYVWAKSENWTWEPIILIVTSGVSLVISLTLWFVSKIELRPRIDLELKWTGGLRTHPELVPESPRDETGQYFVIRDGGVYIFRVSHDYNLIIRNNSSNHAYHLSLFKSNEVIIHFKNRHNPLNPITIDKPTVIELSHNVARKMTHSEANTFNDEKYPDEIKSMLFVASYQNEDGETFFTVFNPPTNNRYVSRFDTSTLEKI